MARIPQWRLAYQYMRDVGSLTSLKALTELGIISFPKRICEMGRQGIKVKKERITVIDRNNEEKRVIRYSLCE